MPTCEAAPTTSTINDDNSTASHESILGQFLPCAVYQVQPSPDSALRSAQAMEVNIKGKMTFYVNRTTQLIHRMDATYLQQECYGGL